MKNGYRIDYTTGTVVITKKFNGIASKNISSIESKILRELQQVGLTITVAQTKPRAKTPTRVTYQKMETYINCLDDGEVWLPRFEGIKEEAKSKKNPYEEVREWFMKNFPEYSTETPVLNEKGKVIHGCVETEEKILPIAE